MVNAVFKSRICLIKSVIASWDDRKLEAYAGVSFHATWGKLPACHVGYASSLPATASKACRHESSGVYFQYKLTLEKLINRSNHDSIGRSFIFRRRRLPHQDVSGHPIFITACLHGSIPAAGLREINLYRQKLEAQPKPDDCGSDLDWELIKHKKLFAMVDHLLDHKSPVNHLSNPAQAKIVRDSFYHFAEERYELLAFVIMPSHHHWLFLPNENWAERALAENREAGKKFQTAREIISHSVQS